MTHRILTPILSAALILSGCAQFSSFQSSPGVAQAETVAIGIGATLAGGSPAYASLAPIAVSGLSALANNKTAVTGVLAQDAPLIVSTVGAMIPNSAGKQAAVKIANAYIAAQPSTPAQGTAVLAAIASGLNTGIVSASK